MKQLAVVYVTVVVALSFITFISYGFDKRRARIDGRRVPEKRLHLMALLGGWPGGWLGQRVFRHKTHKRSFRIAFWACAIAHTFIVGSAIYITMHFQSILTIDCFTCNDINEWMVCYRPLIPRH